MMKCKKQTAVPGGGEGEKRVELPKKKRFPRWGKAVIALAVVAALIGGYLTLSRGGQQTAAVPYRLAP